MYRSELLLLLNFLDWINFCLVWYIMLWSLMFNNWINSYHLSQYASSQSRKASFDGPHYTKSSIQNEVNASTPKGWFFSRSIHELIKLPKLVRVSQMNSTRVILMFLGSDPSVNVCLRSFTRVISVMHWYIGVYSESDYARKRTFTRVIIKKNKIQINYWILGSAIWCCLIRLKTSIP